MPTERVQRQIDRLLDEADEAMSSNDWQVALERATAVLAHDLDNPEGAHQDIQCIDDVPANFRHSRAESTRPVHDGSMITLHFDRVTRRVTGSIAITQTGNKNTA